MELTLNFRFHTSTTLPTNFFCSIPSFCQVQRVSSSSTECTPQENSVITMQYSPNKHKNFVIPARKDSKTEKRNKTRVLSDAQTSEDGMILSLNEKPDRAVRTKENDDSGEDYGDLSFGPNHRSGFVAVIGKPNVGKSTLLNQMIGQKLSIVTDKPQTTRHRILGLCSAPDYQIVLYDTPGVMEKKTHKLDDMMMKNVHTATIDADCLLIVVDACKVPEKINDLLEGNGSYIKEKPPTLLVLNKKDLIKPGEIAKKVEWYTKFGGVDHILPVSAKYGHGVDDVKDWIVSKLPHGPTYYPKDIISEHPERFFVAEIIREKIFMQYRKEIPYACQVNVVNYIARPKSKHFIEVEILVEKETQKMILLGKDGRAIKILATAARLDIEDFLQKEVYLEMKVKVKPNWREDEDFLKRVGYGGEIRVL